MDDGSNQGSTATETHRGTKHRSPSYPAINLETAIRRTQEFYNVERRNAAPFSVAAQHWGLREKSSGALTTVAALKAFGLMRDVDGTGPRRVQLTEDGLKIILDQRANSRDREDALKLAALRPKLHKILWDKYGAEGFSDENVRHFLIWDLKFNENSVADVIRQYRDTIAFAKLADSDKVEEDHLGNIALLKDNVGISEETMDSQQTSKQSGAQLDTLSAKTGVISTPVGKDESGAVAFAHVRFESGIKKEYVASLRKYLDYLEGTLQ